MRSKIQQFLRGVTRTQWLILALCITIIATAVLRFLTPNQGSSTNTLQLNTLRPQGTGIPSSIVFNNTFSPPQTPQTVTVYSYDMIRQPLAGLAIQLGATKTSLNSSYTSEDGRIDLMEELNRDRYILTIQPPRNQFDSDPFLTLSTDKALPVAIAYVQNTLGLEGLRPQMDQTTYSIIEGQEFEEVNSEKEAQVVTFRLYYTVDDKPTSVGIASDPPVIITVDKEYQIRAVEFSPYKIKSTGSQQMQTITAEKAIKMYKNSAVIDQFYRENDTPIPLTSIQSISLEQSDFVYRIDPINKVSMPYYYFRGTASGFEKSASITFLLPAVIISAKQ